MQFRRYSYGRASIGSGACHKKLKEEVSEIYEMLGLDLPTAIRMFLVRSKLERGLPFKAVLPEETVSPAEMVEILKK